MIMCHMAADTAKEMHDMADAIGVSQMWFQGDHYDVSLGRRARAVELGAKEITQRDMVKLLGRRKKWQR
jgi:hypothetical protein